jgi:predicted HicB family RNase H-like nuclease
MKPTDHYLKIVEWSDEDQCYVGACPGLMLGGVHGDDEAQVYAELCETVKEWIAIHEQDGLPFPPSTAGKNYSGKFVVRVGRELHQELAVYALRQGMSLNSYCAKALREGRTPYGSDALAHVHKQQPAIRQDSQYPANATRKKKRRP